MRQLIIDSTKIDSQRLVTTPNLINRVLNRINVKLEDVGEAEVGSFCGTIPTCTFVNEHQINLLIDAVSTLLSSDSSNRLLGWKGEYNHVSGNIYFLFSFVDSAIDKLAVTKELLHFGVHVEELMCDLDFDNSRDLTTRKSEGLFNIKISLYIGQAFEEDCVAPLEIIKGMAAFNF